MRVFGLVVAVLAATEARSIRSGLKEESSVEDLPLHRGRHLQQDIQINTKAAAKAKASDSTGDTEIACPKGCQRHGSCDFSTGACTCEPGYTGDACDTAFVCVDACNYRGLCVSDGVCECASGFTGDLCEVDIRCPDDCSGHGTCAADGGECVCADGYEGELCDVASTPVMPERIWSKIYPPDEAQDIGSKAEERYSAVGVIYGDRLKSNQMVIWGGQGSEETLDSMWLYDHSLRQWHRKMQSGLRPGPRYDAAAVGTDTTMYMFGGYEPCDGADAYSSDFWSFTFKGDKWNRVPTLLDTGLSAGPVGRVGHSLAFVGDTALVMFGGIADTLPLSDTWHWTISSSKWRKLSYSTFGSRRYHASTSVMMGTNEVNLIHGGVNADGGVSDTLAYYNMGAAAWEIISAEGEAPGARQKHSLLYKDSLVFLFGGLSGTTQMNDLWLLNLGTSTPTWQGQIDATGSVEGRASAVALMMQGQVVVAMGAGTADQGSTPTNDVFSISSETQVWEKAVTIGDLPVKRMLMTATVLEDRLWIFGGQDEVGHKLNDLWDVSLVGGDQGHVWTEYAPTSVAAVDSASSYTCGAQSTSGTSSTGQGVVTTEESVQWPNARSGHAAASLSGLGSMCDDYPTLFIFGGLDGNDEATNDLWYWCEGSQQWAEVALEDGDGALLPPPRSSTAIAATNDVVTIFGGMTTDKVRLNDLWECQISSGLCKAMSAAGTKQPHTRRGMSMHKRMSGALPEMLVFGGYWKEKNACSTCAGVVRYVDSDRTIDLWRYQSAYSRWRKVYAAHAPEQRYMPGSCINDDVLFMFGGYSMEGVVEHNDFWAFDMNQAQWMRLPVGEGADCPIGRHSHQMVKWQQAVDGSDTFKTSVVVYGGIGLQGVLGDIWVANVDDVVGISTRAKQTAHSHRGSKLVHLVA